jgi:hypothetical protein
MEKKQKLCDNNTIIVTNENQGKYHNLSEQEQGQGMPAAFFNYEQNT